MHAEEVFILSGGGHPSYIHAHTPVSIHHTHASGDKLPSGFKRTLTNEDRDWMRRSGRDLERWELRFFERFAMTVSQAWAKLNAQSYGPYDVRNERPVSEFVMTCLRLAREAHVMDTECYGG